MLKGARIDVPLYKIPNVALGKANLRHVTRMMFPRLYVAGSHDRSIPAATLARIYNKGIRPAVQAVCGWRLSHWPPSYSAALANARDRHGKLHFGMVDLPPTVIDRFAYVLRRNLDQIPKLQDVYFMHEVRGTKGFTVHDPADAGERWTALQRELGFLDFDNMTLQDWYVDVGLEIYHPQHVLQWLDDAHPRLLQYGLPKQAEIDPISLSRLLEDQRNFATDRVAQFKEFAGFHCTPGRKGHTNRIVYLNVYTTDKEPTYQLHTGSFSKHRASELLPSTGLTKLINDVTTMSAIFGQCMGDGE
jgi:hypothetical protein